MSSLPPLAKPLGVVIRLCRERSQLTQRDVWDAMGADRNTPSKLERGVTNPQLDTLVAVAEALNVSLGEMIVAAETGGPIPDERDGGYGSAKGSTKYPRRPGPLRRVADRPRRRR